MLLGITIALSHSILITQSFRLTTLYCLFHPCLFPFVSLVRLASFYFSALFVLSLRPFQ